MDRPVQPRRRFLQRHGGLVITLVLLVLGAVFVLMPLYWLVSTAFKSGNDAFALPPRYIARPTLSAFKVILGGQFAHYVLNSVIVAFASTAVALLLDCTSVPAASGARTVCPSCTERTARTSASGSTSL